MQFESRNYDFETEIPTITALFFMSYYETFNLKIVYTNSTITLFFYFSYS
jgi:hypothetical protein